MIVTHKGLIWTDDIVNALHAGIAAGQSARMIAHSLSERFGVTVSRNAVVGKAHRLGLQLDGHALARSNATADRTPAQSKPAVKVAAPACPAPPAPDHGSVDINHLRPNHCRWPYGDPKLPGFMYCGCQAKVGRPYCEGHAAIAYEPRPEKKIRKAFVVLARRKSLFSSWLEVA